jgi:hypothetical protein
LSISAIKTKKCDDLLAEITALTAKQTERKSRVSIHILSNNDFLPLGIRKKATGG